METSSCHSNESTWATTIKSIIYVGLMSWTKTQLFVDAICQIWKESAWRLQRRSRLKMLTTDGRQMPANTINSPMSLWLRWANNNPIFIISDRLWYQMYNKCNAVGTNEKSWTLGKQNKTKCRIMGRWVLESGKQPYSGQLVTILNGPCIGYEAGAT